MIHTPFTILAIESSCDETGVAILEVTQGSFRVRANALNSQIAIHQKTHGVVPEVAARRHVEVIHHLVREALSEAQITLDEITHIGVTHGPGLNGSLLIGIEAAKVLAYATRKPLIPINHLTAHIQANFFDRATNKVVDIAYPAIALLVSGGHTELVLIEGPTQFRLLGQTLDDAVGESFDKVAALLGLPYPGGPQVAKRALEGNAEAFAFPIAMKQSDTLNFSYSGLKTAVRQAVEGKDRTEQLIADVCASFQKAAIGQLVMKVEKALKQYHAKTLCVAGGVSANMYLREQLQKHFGGAVTIKVPDFDLCTDNALMIAMATYLQIVHGDSKPSEHAWHLVTSDPALNIAE